MEIRPGQYVWAQVVEEMRRRIREGEYQSGHPIPGAPRLASEFEIAKGTAQRVLEVLREEGLIYTLVGKGTFVAPRDQWKEEE